MKKIILSSLAALTLASGAMAAEAYAKQDTTPVYAKADKLKFSGLAYLGYTLNDYDENNVGNDKDDTSQFEVRRAYFQLKAYLLDDPKSYYRITYDLTQDATGDMKTRAKYAYLYLNKILPFTGVEIGLVHRPWHDYEQYNAWNFRNISKIFLESKNGANLSKSADFGFNFKTKTKYFSSEVGVFNGEGYYSEQATGTGMSLEWRTTAHVLGVSGKGKQKTKTYFDASFFGQYNVEHKKQTVATTDYYNDLVFMGLHTVYNQPEFLVSAQYITSQDTAENSTYVSSEAGDGYSVNGEYRFGENYDFKAIARYDSWTDSKLLSSSEKEDKTYIVGGVWDQNKNIQWVANAIITDNEDGSDRYNYNGVAYMVTAQVKF